MNGPTHSDKVANNNTNANDNDNNSKDAIIEEIVQSCTAEAQLTTRENEILALYDEALELDLEAALLQATASLDQTNEEKGTGGNAGEWQEVKNGLPSSRTEGSASASSPNRESRDVPNHRNDEEKEEEEEVRSAISKAEHAAMEARADYMLRNKIVQNVVIADPVLKVVHGGRDDAFADRLLPLINDRDVLSMLQTNLAAHQVYLSTITAQISRDVMLANMENEKLSAKLLELIASEKEMMENVEKELIAEGLEGWRRGDGDEDRMDVDGHEHSDNGDGGGVALVDDSCYAARVRKVNRELKDLKREKQIYKGVAIGIVVNSGVDWARDEELRELVMDDEESEE